MDEKKLEKAVVALAKNLGIHTIKLASSNNRGQPDRMFLYEGRTMFMELKGAGKKPTALQVQYIEKLTKLGFVAEVVDNIDRAKEMLYALLNEGSY